MPAIISDIHEISFIVGLLDETISSESDIISKFDTFKFYEKKYGNGNIDISKSNFYKKEDLFDRGLQLAKELISKYNLEGNSIRWTGLEDHKIDSSDVYSDGIGISLKDSSKIIRNNSFEQLLNTFCKTTLKPFKDPFWEFSPSLSSKFISTVIKSCYKSGFLKIESNKIKIDGENTSDFNGNINDLLSSDLLIFHKLFKKIHLKKLVKEFSFCGDVQELLKVRKNLIEDVQEKIIAVFKEGLLHSPDFIGNNFKKLLQYSNNKKYFGFSASNLIYCGIIPTKSKTSITPSNVYTEKSKLTAKTTGLQINIYTDLKINFGSSNEKLKLQNQLRYKHKTFSCAPEANLHILNYNDWKKIYPKSC